MDPFWIWLLRLSFALTGTCQLKGELSTWTFRDLVNCRRRPTYCTYTAGGHAGVMAASKVEELDDKYAREESSPYDSGAAEDDSLPEIEVAEDSG